MAKIIQAYPKPGKNFRTEAVWQWDSGCIVHLNDVDLPPSYKVEFSNVSVRGTAKSSILTGENIEIPSEYQESGEPVYIWIVYVDEASRETVLSIITPVNNRSKPIDAPLTPEEQSEAEQIMAVLNAGVERVEQIADDIPQAIDDALTAAKESGEFDGKDGSNGYTPQKGIDYFDGKDGLDGEKGADGYSPTATVIKTGDTATIAIIDKNGTTTATVKDGQDGANGKDGVKGDTGDSGVYYGEMVPSDPNVKVWIDPNGDADTPVIDVQINNGSIVVDGVAYVPVATFNNVGLVKAQTDYGIGLNPKGDGGLRVEYADDSIIKKGTGAGSLYKPIVPYTQHYAVFYGLAKAAGADMALYPNSIGDYTNEAKLAIRGMLGVKNCDPQSIAIVSNGDIHTSIASGQYVYVQNHSSLTEGLYKAKEAIQVNGALSLSKLTAVSNGGLNALNSMIPEQLIHMGTENDYPVSAAHTEYQMGITLIYTRASTSYPHGTGTVVTIRAASARCVQFSFGNTAESCSMRAADNNGWSAWKTYTGS